MPNLKTKSSHLVIIFNDLSIGGIERKIIDITKHYSSSSAIKATLLLKHKQGPLLEQLPPQVTIVSPSTKLPRRLSSLFFPFWLSYQISKAKPSLILSFGNYCSITAIIAKLLAFSRTPLIVSEDSSITTQLKHDSFPSLRIFLVRILYPLATRIITLTSSGSSKLSQLSSGTSNKLIILPNWLPLNFSSYSAHLKKRTNNILFLGRFERQKNPLLFLEICKSILIDHPKLRISMYGHGSLDKKIRQYISTNNLSTNISVHPASLSTPDIFKNSQIMLLTSTHEGFPLTILESTASGCLPVCRSINEITPFFTKGPNHLLFNTKAQAISSIKYLLTHTKTANTLADYYQKRTLSHQASDFEKTIHFLNQYL